MCVWAERRWIRRAFATSDRISLLMERGLAGLILQFYELAYIERWNDHPKPFHITELDKQAHKATIAYVVGRFEEHLRGVSLDWDYLIRGLIFEALQRSVLTDIKPQIFHRLLRERSGELSAFVLEELRDDMEGFSADLRGRFERYLKGEDVKERERRIIRASHFLATYWEFQMIYSTGLKFYGIERVKEEIEDTIEEFFDLVGVERIYLRKKTFNFVDLVGQLRFQKRWIQSPRLPTTTVLGHMFIVASLSYLLSFRAGLCERRRFLNFFSGLFHDLPEVTTRDIVAPIKRRAGIGDILKEYEREQVERIILPLLPDFLREEFAYILGFADQELDEFTDRIREKGRAKRVERMDREECRDPVDGTLIRACDYTGAYVEARLSIHHGVTSRHLEKGCESIRRAVEGMGWLGVSFGDILSAVDERLKEDRR